jgi:hypothetical protein
MDWNSTHRRETRGRAVLRWLVAMCCGLATISVAGCRMRDEVVPVWSPYPAPVTSWRSPPTAELTPSGPMGTAPWSSDGVVVPPAPGPADLCPRPGGTVPPSIPCEPLFPSVLPPCETTPTPAPAVPVPEPPPPEAEIRPEVAALQAAQEEIARLAAAVEHWQAEAARLSAEAEEQSRREVEMLDELSKSLEEVLGERNPLKSSAGGGAP